MEENNISAHVVESALRVHRALGPGLLESVYRKAMTHELRKRGLHVHVEFPVSIVYDGVKLGEGFADHLVAGKVILEVKSTDGISSANLKQLLTYLRFSGRRLGLLINFNVPLIKEGIRRVVNKLDESPGPSHDSDEKPPQAPSPLRT